MDMSKNYLDRFWSKVEVTGFCWNWVGAVTSAGYGNFAVAVGEYSTAHRYSYRFLVGDIPHGLDLDHLCRNRVCINPDHLEPVTRSENVLRGVSALRHANRAKTHCKRGHEFVEGSYYKEKTKTGFARKCKKCLVIRNREWVASKSLAA